MQVVIGTGEYLLSRLSLSDYLLEALTVLKNRGYDSAGLATMTAEGGPLVRKDLAHAAWAGEHARLLTMNLTPSANPL
jgi:glucosamine 6-phosphate synthetase-like amidotransferase/phosphosugar isomerase protein